MWQLHHVASIDVVPYWLVGKWMGLPHEKSNNDSWCSWCSVWLYSYRCYSVHPVGSEFPTSNTTAAPNSPQPRQAGHIAETTQWVRLGPGPYPSQSDSQASRHLLSTQPHKLDWFCWENLNPNLSRKKPMIFLWFLWVVPCGSYIATDKYLEHHLEKKNLKIVTAGMF